MANKYRGEVDVEIDGRKYPIALNLEAIGRLAEAFGVETIVDVEKRLLAFRAADMKPTLVALLESSGHQADGAALSRLDGMSYLEMVRQLFEVRATKPADDTAADPQKRAKR